ncbi:glycosyltransferase [Fusibacter paucivorans]|uniref:Glycosyltransferase n=1 Tax=Fusibacter paucivorans TaxID=76009 RepID=A0ABS5PSP4_9FIRM|nr:glycosyltransferase [Fusibacter paucivorans]MBS7528101.1 glycosyltransferase [Fusibacter paucivorans]
MKKKVLIMAGYYLPSVKGGGPIQSIKNIVDNLSDEFDFYIVATDRDLGDSKPFEDIEIDKWIRVGKANVYYTDVSTLDLKKTKIIIDSSYCKTMYLNSFFDYKFSIVPLILNKFKKLDIDKIIVAPRGQFFPGALGLKSNKKRLFISVSKIFGLYKNLCWHATADSEKVHIQKVFGDEINIVVANNLTANYSNLTYDKNLKKSKGELSVVFVSRIHPKKNLKLAIQLLSKISGTVIFNIYGPIEDNEYWNDCKQEITLLPKNVKVVYQGIINHEEIINVFKKHHVFLFPTLGENFGHVISEALIGGCPVIISDQTPWRNLEEAQVGWDIELQNNKKFIEVLQYNQEMTNAEFQKYSKKAFMYGKEKSNVSENILSYYNIF